MKHRHFAHASMLDTSRLPHRPAGNHCNQHATPESGVRRVGGRRALKELRWTVRQDDRSRSSWQWAMNYLYAKMPPSVSSRSHRATTATPPARLRGSPTICVAANCRRQSAVTSGGISRRARANTTGSRINSSSMLRMGMKSGIRSIGLSAYARAATINQRTARGVRGSRAAR